MFIIIFIVIAIIRALGAAKKKSQANAQEQRPGASATVTREEESFEDILKVFTIENQLSKFSMKEKREQPRKEQKHIFSFDDPYEENDYEAPATDPVRQKYEKYSGELHERPEVMDSGRFKIFKGKPRKRKNKKLNPYLKLMRKKDFMQKAFIAGEVLNRKY